GLSPMINLLPPETKEEIRYGRFNVLAVQYAALVIAVSLSLLAVLLFGVAVVSTDEQSLKENLKDKEAVLAEFQDDLAEAKELEGRIDTISALLEREVSFSALLQDIGSVIPNGASLTGLSLTGDETLPLRIAADINNQSLAAVLQENLENSDLFENADIQNVAASEFDEAGNAIRYNVQIMVNFEKRQV